MAEPLANDPHNACVGCGPANPRGLRLRFERTPEGTRGAFAPEAWMEGWPGTTHTAFLYLALIETMNWTVYARRDRLGLPTRTGALETHRRVATGEPLTLEGRALHDEGDAFFAEAVARDASGALVARLERDYAFPDRAEVARRLGFGELPPMLSELVPE
jgi:hypothetical protein